MRIMLTLIDREEISRGLAEDLLFAEIAVGIGRDPSVQRDRAGAEHGDPNEGLKLLQVGTVTALDIPPDEQRAVVVGGSSKAAVQAIALVDSATALADLDEPEKAKTELARSRELWSPTRADSNGDLDRPWTARPQSSNSPRVGWTRRNRSPRRRCAAGKVLVIRWAPPTPAPS